MAIKKKIIIFIIIILFLILSIMIPTFIRKTDIKRKKTEVQKEFYIESEENDKVLLVFKNIDGIKQIVYPNGDVLYVNGRNKIALDYSVQKKQTYTFELQDVNDNIYYESFITPTANVAIIRKDVNVTLEDMKDDITKQLNNNKIATNFVNIIIGERSSIDSETTDMSVVFNSWNSFGDGIWSYNSSAKMIRNSKNSEYFTGYYAPNEDYTDIELSFNAKTTDGDDDMIGAMIRFNDNSSKYTSYLFLLDGHDYNGGVINGAYNGLNKIQNKSLTNSLSPITKLSVNSSLRWIRNTWQNYKLIAKGNKIETYIDNKLVASATDSSISSGTYGFLSFSQANTYFKDITIKTLKEYNLLEVLNKVNWTNDDINVVVNLNNSSEPAIQTNELVDLFNNNNIYYLGVTKEDNQQEITEFLSKINDRGKGIDSTDYDTYVQEITQFLTQYMNNQF